MSSAWQKLVQLLPLFGLMGAGFLLGSRYRVDHRGINVIVLYLAVPCMMIDKMTSGTAVPWGQFPGIFACLSFIVAGSWLATRVLSPLVEQRSETWNTGVMRPMAPPVMIMSYAYASLPFARKEFGDVIGTQLGTLVYLAGALIAYTLGVYLLSGTGSIRAILRLPLIYSLSLGIALNASGWQIPGPIRGAISDIGSVAEPLILVAIGIQLASMRVRNVRLAFAGGLLRICLGGLLGLAACSLIPRYIPGLHLDINAKRMVLMVSMLPSAAINAILADFLGSERDANEARDPASPERDKAIVESVVVASYVLFACVGSVLVSILFS